MRNKLLKLFASNTVKRFKDAATTAQIKNTFDGENLSAIFKIANTNVPIIKPNCTAEVKCARAETSRLKLDIKSVIIAFPANHKDVQQN
ncbi:hypothetical protein GCM10023315_21410 [Algibacter aquimarinus]|uniref:Uncharacterized protein n=1 Tax=Algibacter aquimarinus TaxID=1136748 RepID=A0ABP9HHJ6_9FLAO